MDMDMISSRTRSKSTNARNNLLASGDNPGFGSKAARKTANIKFNDDSTDTSMDEIPERPLSSAPATQDPCFPPPENPSVPSQLFCQPRTGEPGKKTDIFRLRDGDPKFIAGFLAQVTGLDAIAEHGKGTRVWPFKLDPPSHLIHAIRHTKIDGGSSFETRNFYSAIGDSCALSVGGERVDPEYRLLSPLASTLFSSGPLRDGLKLESYCTIKCGSCGRWYEVRVYR